MGKRGPKQSPKTTVEPGPMPARPAWVEGEKAVEFWNEYGPALNRLGLLESLDAVAFGLLADAFEGYLSARDELAKVELTVVVGENGAEQQHPLVAVVRQQTKAVREFLSEFGLTPSSRTALTGSTAATRVGGVVDPLDELAAQFGAVEPSRETRPTTPKRRAAAAAKRKPAKRKPAAKRKPGKA